MKRADIIDTHKQFMVKAVKVWTHIFAAFCFFTTFEPLNINPQNEKHEKESFINYCYSIYFSVTGSEYIKTDDLQYQKCKWHG
ncbi:hypothetical protein F070042J6_43220 [Bacteroides sp. f07]